MNLMSRMFGASRGGRSKEEPQADMSSAALLDAATAIGMDILSRAAGELGIAPEEAAAIIGPDGGIPSSIEAISARAAQALAGCDRKTKGQAIPAKLDAAIRSGFGGKGLCRHVRRPVQAAQRAVQEIRGGRKSRKAVTIDRYM